LRSWGGAAGVARALAQCRAFAAVSPLLAVGVLGRGRRRRFPCSGRRRGAAAVADLEVPLI